MEENEESGLYSISQPMFMNSFTATTSYVPYKEQIKSRYKVCMGIDALIFNDNSQLNRIIEEFKVFLGDKYIKHEVSLCHSIVYFDIDLGNANIGDVEKEMENIRNFDKFRNDIEIELLDYRWPTDF